MTTTTSQNVIVVKVSDRSTDAYLDRIEKAAQGRIASHKDDSCGTMTLYIVPCVRPTKPQKKVIMQAVQAITPNAYWS